MKTLLPKLLKCRLAQAGGCWQIVNPDATNAASPYVASVYAPFTLTVLADDDADRLPDVWETACGLCQTNANHAIADDDGDGQCNGAEYTAGTDPTNALSCLKVDAITLAEGGTATTLVLETENLLQLSQVRE